MNQRSLARKNLERRLAPLRGESFAAPARGWLRSLRDALGMTSAQLAHRLGVTQPRIIALEKAEAQGSVTIRTLREAAAAMDCTLVYAIVPRQPLDDMMRNRAIQRADIAVARGQHSMALENQALTAEDLAAERERITTALIAGSPRRLWDEP